MARVWAARLTGQRGFQKLLAIKTILPHLAEEQEFERMFLDEARIASGVHHPNVCEIYELGEEKRQLYLAMEWVSGDSFSRVMRVDGKTTASDPRVVARVVADACAGVHAAHELRDETGRSLEVVHRDLSPHNILVSNDGVSKVADFGVAKAMGQLHEATSAGQLKGKIAYMAPEQVTGGVVDRRSDVFSLGCVIYEATTGQRPFRGDGDHQVMHAILKGEVQPPSTFMRGYPPDLERIMMRALSPQPILRFPSAERMRFALEEYLTKGMLVTQANVAQLVKQRIGEHLERRRERIRQASSLGDREGGWSEPPGAAHTPSGKDQRSGISGVKQAARPLYSTLQMSRSEVNREAASQRPPAYPSARGATQPPPPMNGQAAPPFHLDPGSATSLQHQSPSFTPPPAPAFPNMEAGPLSTTAMMVSPLHSLPPHPSAAMLQAMTNPSFSPLAPPVQPNDPYAQPPPGYGPPPSSQGSPIPVSQYLLAAGAGVLLAVAIGVGSFFLWRKGNNADRTVAPQTQPQPTGQTGLVTSSSAQPALSPPATADIVFKMTPDSAVLSVDGVPLERRSSDQSKAIARPAVGKTVTVVAHAPGYEDVTILVDYFTTSPMDLALKPETAEADTPDASAKGGDKPDKPKKPRNEPIPANPY